MKAKNLQSEQFPTAFVVHDRRYDWKNCQSKPAGGQCTVYIVTGEGTAVVGQAQCGPKDQYSRRSGRSIAYGRALRAIMLLGGIPKALDAHKAVHRKMGKLNMALTIRAYRGYVGKDVTEGIT